jgi:hypothetical protein
MLHAEVQPELPQVVVYDGDEMFVLEAVEALYYELVEATECEQRHVERFYRLLRQAEDFRRWAA